jgi:hypothetical protein
MVSQTTAWKVALLLLQITIDMKTILLFLTFIICGCCTGQNEPRQQFPRHTTFYWEKNSENEFHAIRLDSAYCSLTSFGPNELNYRQTLALHSDGNIFRLINPETGEQIAHLTISADSLLSLQILRRTNVTYRMIRSLQFGSLFNLLKAKYLFECIASNNISYNGITPEMTTVDNYLLDSQYQQVSETIGDEIYGTETFYYLAFRGNRFYYIPKKSGGLFDKIEIISNDISNFFLDIRIGDTFDQVINKMKDKVNSYRVSDDAITIDVCNSRFIGRFGTLIFRFHRIRTQGKVLERIIYQPLLESE